MAESRSTEARIEELEQRLERLRGKTVCLQLSLVSICNTHIGINKAQGIEATNTIVKGLKQIHEVFEEENPNENDHFINGFKKTSQHLQEFLLYAGEHMEKAVEEYYTNQPQKKNS